MKYLFLISLMLAPNAVAAQSEKVTLTGQLVMETGEKFTYRIVGVDSNDVLRGYAYTYDAPDETKVTLKGKIDKQHHKLTFREIAIVESHDMHTTAFMCLLRANLELNGNILSGTAKSAESDNTACTSGTLTFKNPEEVTHLFATHDKYDIEVTMGGNKKKEPAAQEPAYTPTPAAEVPAKQEKITAGVEKTYDWHSDTVVVDIWDGGQIDDDRVSVAFDQKYYLQYYFLEKAKKRIRIPLTDFATHSLSIRADDEGFEPLNTASITLTDGKIVYNILAYNKKGNISMVKIKKVGKR